MSHKNSKQYLCFQHPVLMDSWNQEFFRPTNTIEGKLLAWTMTVFTYTNKHNAEIKKNQTWPWHYSEFFSHLLFNILIGLCYNWQKLVGISLIQFRRKLWKLFLGRSTIYCTCNEIRLGSLIIKWYLHDNFLANKEKKILLIWGRVKRSMYFRVLNTYRSARSLDNVIRNSDC